MYMDNERNERLLEAWWAENIGQDFEDLLKNRPLLAHYTSTEVAESIIREETIWMSHPYYMNDTDEMNAGINIATEMIFNDTKIAHCCQHDNLHDAFRNRYAMSLKALDNELLDVYVFCLTEHDSEDYDGQLSMWRGYGGYGKGVALVFNSSFADESGNSPLILSRVEYMTYEERKIYIQSMIENMCQVISNMALDAQSVQLAAEFLFRMCVLKSMTTKHSGFKEEREWRIFRMPYDENADMIDLYIDYHIGMNGIEPKLKLPIKPLPSDPEASWNFASILDRIIIGPSVSSPLAEESFKRMLVKREKAALTDRVFISQIPLRAS